jgi:hypothetical protein
LEKFLADQYKAGLIFILEAAAIQTLRPDAEMQRLIGGAAATVVDGNAFRFCISVSEAAHRKRAVR